MTNDKSEDQKFPTAKLDSGAASEASSQELKTMPLAVQAQYLKDLSFESPHAPSSLMDLKQAPQVSVEININAHPMKDIGGNIFEVELALEVRAGDQEKPAFIAELVYAGMFAVGKISKEALQPLLLIECPRLLFPFARSILGAITRDGGFPPLMINPIDFAALYNEKRGAAKPPAGQA